jgi:uncharacterized protein with NAD-binding domain and iron-sulfur cluster
MAGRPRIAILGGGAGGVTAALQLSNREDWKEHYESITLYQQGWRLGGKGACGRGPHQRIEEHGLHIWFGFYENAFRLLDGCHRELDRRADEGDPRWNLTFTNVADSVSPLNELAVADHDGCAWRLWMADFFDDDNDRPWYPRHEGIPDEWTAAFYLERCLRLAADLAWSLVESDPRLDVAIRPASEARDDIADIDDALDAVLAALGGDVRRVLGATADFVDVLLEATLRDPLVLGMLDVVVRALDHVLDFLRRRFSDEARASHSVRRVYYVVDLLVAIARGLIEDGVLEQDDLDVIDDFDLRDWLLRHGASRETIDCALIRAIVYDLGFAYEGGDPARPACGAGTALRGLLRSFFTYRGSLMYRMNAGMGDVVFLPFYELLVKRGVEVMFFNRVEELHVADGAIKAIEIDLQAEVPADTTAQTYVTPPPHIARGVAAGPPPPNVWPASPREILRGPAGAPPAGPRVSAADYESWYAGRDVAKVSTKTLRCGRHFDLVVFGLPISCVPNVAGQLVASSQRWRKAVNHVRTVPTQALQLWLNRPAPKLARVESGTVASGFVEPFDTWADMTQLVVREQVPGSKTVAYFCSVLADAPGPPRGAPQAREWLDEQDRLVAAQAVRFLTNDIGALWPLAVDRVSGEFRWKLLVDPDDGSGQLRLQAQYWRANVEPSERYVLSVPGSSRYRIQPADTGFANLYAVGDWTACHINAGCVEAAVISAMVAANAIHAAHDNPDAIDPVIGLKEQREGARHGG